MNRGEILVADDDAAIRTVVAQALSRAGYEVHYGNGGDALALGSGWGRGLGRYRRRHA